MAGGREGEGRRGKGSHTREIRAITRFSARRELMNRWTNDDLDKKLKRDDFFG